MAVVFSAENKKTALASLRRYCHDELELEVSDIGVASLFEFVVKEIAPVAYNAGVSDAQAFLRDRVADLEGVCYEPEFTWWPKGSSPRPK